MRWRINPKNLIRIMPAEGSELSEFEHRPRFPPSPGGGRDDLTSLRSAGGGDRNQHARGSARVGRNADPDDLYLQFVRIRVGPRAGSAEGVRSDLQLQDQLGRAGGWRGLVVALEA